MLAAAAAAAAESLLAATAAAAAAADEVVDVESIVRHAAHTAVLGELAGGLAAGGRRMEGEWKGSR